MPEQKGKVLIVEDEKYYAKAYQSRLKRHGYETETAIDVPGAFRKLKEFTPDVIILDLMLQQQDIEEGFSVLQEVTQSNIEAKVIVVTSHGRTTIAERALQLGAYDFIDKEERGYDELTFRVNQAYDRVQLERRIKDLRDAEIDRIGGYRYGRDGVIVGTSELMRQLYRQIDKMAPTDATVLILGESGAGKELVAEAIHKSSPRADRMMVTVNCGAIPAELIESELFGYVKGAHSQATSNKKGLFEEAHGSTLFLDEIGDLPLPLQVKLLRAIEKGEIRRVGDTRPIVVDVRIIAATNKTLESAIAKGEFREDLYFRLNMLPLEVPPLRERKEDIPLLATYFLEKCNEKQSKNIKGFQEEAIAFLKSYPAPGNVRELEHCVHRAVLFSTGDWITADDLKSSTAIKVDERKSRSLSQRIAAYEATLAGDGSASLPQLLAECEAAFIRQALSSSSSQQEAANKLGITESGLRSKMDKYNIPRVRASAIRKKMRNLAKMCEPAQTRFI